MTLKELIEKFGSKDKIPYCDLIKCDEWYAKRKSIIERDNERCIRCGKKGELTIAQEFSHYEKEIIPDEEGNPIEVDVAVAKTTVIDANFGLHVHHKYYILEYLPWEYPNEALITLCVKCHENENRTS